VPEGAPRREVGSGHERVFVADISHRLAVIDELHLATERAFRRAGVEVVLPQRDVRPETWRPVDVLVVGGSEEPGALHPDRPPEG
jgi:small-conductance mechanosensitive channel